MFKSLFGRKIDDAKANLKKVENRDRMEAIVGGCLLVAAASAEPGSDKPISDAELLSLDAQIQSNPSLSHFGAEIGKTINLFESQLNTGFRIGKLKIMRELDDIKNNKADAEEVMVNVLTIAEADGEIDPKEMVVLKEIATALGLRLADFGITA